MRPTAFASFRSLFAISDEQAMWRVKMQDDEGAFAQLMRRWEGPIQRLCTRMTGDAHRAQDLTQETFVRVFARRKEYRPDGKFSTWLWRVALNLCYDELRRQQRRAESSLDEAGDDMVARLETYAAPELAPDGMLADRERDERVRKALMRLPDRYRAVLTLRHYEDLKFCEIGQVLGIPEGTVKSRMAEALTRLGKLLNPMNEGQLCNHKNQRTELRAL